MIESNTGGIKMNKNTHQELKKTAHPVKEESEIVVPSETKLQADELGEFALLLSEIKTPMKEPNTEQWDKARVDLMSQIEKQKEDFLTTFKDKFTATDSVLCRLIVYIALILVLVILAVAGFFIYQELTVSTTEAAGLFDTFPV